MITIAVIACLVSAYLLPAIIAWRREAYDRWAIFLLALLFGWTLFGWLAAFLWACFGARRATVETERLMHAALTERRARPTYRT